MSTSTTESAANAVSIRIVQDRLVVELSDGREIRVPLAWYPRLAQGTSRERQKWELIGKGTGIHWPDLDEHVSVAGIIAGRRSAESQKSLARWAARREKPSPAKATKTTPRRKN
jgi:hypothetical protein